MIESVPGWAQIIVGIAAVLGAWQVIWKRGLLPLYTAARIWEEVAAEFRPNGGGSLRDAVDRIDARTDAIDGKVATIEKRWTDRTVQLDTVARTLEEHLSHPQWWQERDPVLERLTTVVEGQALILASLLEVLAEEQSPPAVRVRAVLQNAAEQTRRLR